jgi:hypothetical protein
MDWPRWPASWFETRRNATLLTMRPEQARSGSLKAHDRLFRPHAIC